MPPLPPPPPPRPQTGMPPAPPVASGGKKEVEIVTIPDKFYGMALKMKAEMPPEPPKPAPTPAPAPRPVAPVVMAPRRSRLPIILVVLFLLLAIGGGFVYLNRDLLFKKPTPVASTPTPPSAPGAPANLTSNVSGSDSVALAWIDAATNETGYRLERREGDGTFLPLTNLPSNSTAFLDVSVQAGKVYAYRVIASNEGGDSSPSNESSVTMAVALPPPAPTPTLPPGGLDSDSDGLTDVEESLYATDQHVPDADKDGFLDGNEVFHLYNPAATAPIRLADSGLVTQFAAPAGWSLYVPKAWSPRLDRPDGSSAVIDTKHGETIVIKLEDNAQRLPLLDWFLSKNPGILSSSVRSLRTKGGLEGIQSPDRMTMFFAWDGKVFNIRYDIDGQAFVNYRTTFEMILNSLTLTGAPVVEESTVNAPQGPGAFVPTEAATGTAPVMTTSTQS